MNPTIKAALILVLVFATGGLAGFIAGKRLDDSPSRFRGPGLDPFRREAGVVEHIENRLTRIYDLTEEQKLDVRKILDEAQLKYDSFYQECRPKFENIRRAQQAAIRELMTPEQRERFEKWLEERRRRGPNDGRGRESRGGGPGGPRPPREGPPPESADSSQQ